MCSIFGSFSKDKLVELAELNMYRGQHSYSFSFYDPYNRHITYMQRSLGSIPLDQIRIPKGEYCIAHMQAPTTDNKSDKTIHPANIGQHYLWHNGIVKDKWVKEYSSNILIGPNAPISWDTFLILYKYLTTGSLNDIDGTFSCLYYRDGEGLELFRNEISPMFVDEESNISSTKFNRSFSLEPNKVWTFNPGQPIINSMGSFNTVENPYFFMDEVK